MTVKVFGEARSATTYLEDLFEKHGFDVLPNGVGTPSGWKHGFPKHTNGALHVLLMRDACEWIRSMMTGFDARWNGLQSKFGGTEDHWGYWQHPMECRTDKYRAYIRFAKRHGAVLLKTEHLKGCPEMITEFTALSEVDDITEHVRLGIDSKDDPKRPTLTKQQKEWIRNNTDKEIEKYVDQLTYQDYR